MRARRSGFDGTRRSARSIDWRRTNRTAARWKVCLRQIQFEAVEVFGQTGAGLADIAKRPASSSNIAKVTDAPYRVGAFR
ncbi:MAG: hypothetical protein B7W97_01955 [Mycobacterium sp. 20-66-4]|nr:MAG: hypothetical protein B7W97_01955 [Mycobacterium sp. 20-66-4]